MPGIVGASMLNHLNDEIRDAIIDVGGDLTGVTCPFDYPKIVRDLLVAVTGPKPEKPEIFKPGFGIDFHDAGDCTYISSNSGGIMNVEITLSNGEIIPSGCKIQEAMEILAANNTCVKLTDQEVEDMFDGIFNNDLK